MPDLIPSPLPDITYQLITHPHTLEDTDAQRWASLLPTEENMIKKTPDQLKSATVCCIAKHKQQLIGAIGLWEQAYNGKNIYQRGSLFVDKNYRGKIYPNLGIAGQLISIINQKNTEKPIYGIACIEKVAEINLADHQIVRKAADIEYFYPSFDAYIEKVRGEKPLESRRKNGVNNVSKKYEGHRVIINQTLMDILTAEKKSPILQSV